MTYSKLSMDVFDAVTRAIESNLNIFSSRGFRYIGVSPETSQPDRPRIRFQFENDKTRMRLWVTFSPAQNGLNGGFVVFFMASNGGRLNLNDYLRLHGYVAEALLFSFKENIPSFDKYLDAFLSMLNRVFSNQLKPILAGTTWESTPIHWQGYK